MSTMDSRPALLLLGIFTSGGVRPMSAELADRLAARGWDVRLLSTRPGRLARVLHMAFGLLRHRRAFAVAHIDVFSGSAFIWAEMTALLLRRLGKPYVLTLRGGNLPAFAARWPRRTAALLRSARAVTAPSRYLKEAVEPWHPAVIVIPNALDLARYATRPPRRMAAPRLVWLRAFHRLYSPELGPAVVAVLRKEFPNLHLTMTGPDKGDGSLQRTVALARSLEVQSSITIGGPIPKAETPARLAEADIFLNTATVDNAPVTVMEALASGLCVVSTRVGGVPWLVRDGVEALLVDPADPVAMADAIRRILRDPDLAARLSEAGRRRASDFDWSRVLPQWEQLFMRSAGPEPVR